MQNHAPGSDRMEFGRRDQREPREPSDSSAGCWSTTFNTLVLKYILYFSGLLGSSSRSFLRQCASSLCTSGFPSVIEGGHGAHALWRRVIPSGSDSLGFCGPRIQPRFSPRPHCSLEGGRPTGSCSNAPGPPGGGGAFCRIPATLRSDPPGGLEGHCHPD